MPSNKIKSFHKNHRSAAHKSKGKYARQTLRTGRNKAVKAARAKRHSEARKAAGTWKPYGSLRSNINKGLVIAS